MIRYGESFACRAHLLNLLVLGQILREDYVSQRKQWEEEQAKSAPEMPTSPDEEEKEVRQESWSKVVGEGFDSCAISRASTTDS